MFPLSLGCYRPVSFLDEFAAHCAQTAASLESAFFPTMALEPHEASGPDLISSSEMVPVLFPWGSLNTHLKKSRLLPRHLEIREDHPSAQTSGAGPELRCRQSDFSTDPVRH